MTRTSTVSLLLLAIFTSAARADIAIDFIGGSAPGNSGFLGGGAVQKMQPDEMAGLVPQAYWNAAGMGNLPNRLGNNAGALVGKLVDETGKILPTASVSWVANNNSSTIIPDAPGNSRMMKGYLDSADPSNPMNSSTSTVNLTIPEEYAKATYDLIVYFDGNSSVGNTDRVGRYRVFSGKSNTGTPLQAIYGKSAWDADFNGTFTEASGSSVTQASTGNYVVFRGLTARTITLDATGMRRFAEFSTLKRKTNPVLGANVIIGGDQTGADAAHASPPQNNPDAPDSSSIGNPNEVLRAPINAIQIVSGHPVPADPRKHPGTDVASSNDPTPTSHTPGIVDNGSTLLLPDYPLNGQPVSSLYQPKRTTVSSDQLRPQMVRTIPQPVSTIKPSPKSTTSVIPVGAPLPLPTGK